MAEVPPSEDDDSEVSTITDGYFEEEFHVDADDAGEFLVELGEQFRDGDEVVISGDDWEIPFRYDEPVELEIEFAGDDDPELEIELELSGRRDADDAPDVA